MDQFYYDWYEIVEEQSNDRVAVKALTDVDFEINITDPRGFLVIDPDETPEDLKPFLAKDEAEPICPLGSPKILIKNNKLRKYLKKAKAFTIYEIGDDQYLELLFKEKEEEEQSLVADEALDMDNLDNLLEESPVYHCWDIFQSGQSREELEVYVKDFEEKVAQQVHEFKILDKEAEMTIELFQKLIIRLFNTAILAVMLAWLKRFQEAGELVKTLGLAPMRFSKMSIMLRYYLEILMAFNQKDILAEFFADELLRNGYLTHYEIYMQMFIDPAYKCTRTQQIKVVKKRIQTFKETDF